MEENNNIAIILYYYASKGIMYIHHIPLIVDKLHTFFKHYREKIDYLWKSLLPEHTHPWVDREEKEIQSISGSRKHRGLKIGSVQRKPMKRHASFW